MLVVVTTGCVGWVALKWLQFTRIPCQSVGGMELAQLLVRYRGDLGKMVVSLNATDTPRSRCSSSALCG